MLQHYVPGAGCTWVTPAVTNPTFAAFAFCLRHSSCSVTLDAYTVAGCITNSATRSAASPDLLPAFVGSYGPAAIAFCACGFAILLRSAHAAAGDTAASPAIFPLPLLRDPPLPRRACVVAGCFVWPLTAGGPVADTAAPSCWITAPMLLLPFSTRENDLLSGTGLWTVLLPVLRIPGGRTMGVFHGSRRPAWCYPCSVHACLFLPSLV